MSLDDLQISREQIHQWIVEDGALEDITTLAVIDPDTKATAVLIAKKPGVIAGLDIADAVFRYLDAYAVFEKKVNDGSMVDAGTIVARLEGRLRAMLSGERLALNLLQRCSGIATLTRKYVEAVNGTGAVILDTRKTTPGLRAVEKYAVRVGGGQNHRMSLKDMALIKDNHIKGAGGISEVVKQAKSFGLSPIEVEVTNIDELQQAIETGVDIVLLDNFSLDEVRKAVAIAKNKVVLEVSGSVTPEFAKEVARLGVERISVGAITHSAGSLDISMEVEKVWAQ
jgi:nicotinate-nucleotide pyrophosphorylase (carboxylating)